MRLNSLAPMLVGGLLIGWAAGAQAAPAPPASAPPAEPIFYCPTAPAQAAASHGAASHAALRRAGDHHRACPSERMAHADHGDHHGHWRGHDGDHRMASRDHDDVSESQAFIYRYERAHNGFDARAADEAWAHGGPHGPQSADADERWWREHQAHVDGDHHDDHMMGPDHHDGDHMMGPGHHDDADEGADRDGNRHYGYLDEHRGHGEPMGPPAHADAEAALRADDGHHAGYLYERREQETSSGWSSSGWTSSEHASGGAVRGHAWTYQSGDTGWVGHGARAGDGQWRDGSYGRVVEYAGRDAHGYLVWPGKTPQPRPDADPDPDHDR